MNRSLKAGLGYTIGNYLLKGLSFFTLPLFSRLMTTSDYGIYNTFLAYESVVFVLIGCSIHSSYKNAKYKYNDDSKATSKGVDYNTYISDTIIFLCGNFVVWLILCVLPINWNKYLGLTKFEIVCLIFYSFSTAVITCYNSYVGLDYEYNKFLLVSAANSVGNIVLSLCLILGKFKTVKYLGRILGTTIPVFIIAIWIIIWFLKRTPPKNMKKMLKWGVKYSLPIVPHGLSQVILTQFDRIMILQMVGASQAGIYSFAYTLYTIVNITAQSLDNVWLPWFYEHMNKAKYNIIRNRCKDYVILMSFFSCFVMCLCPELVVIMGSVKYRDSIYCVIPLVASGFFSFLYTLPSAIEYYYEKTKFIMLGSMGAALINIILNYIFIKKYGYIAAAYTTFVTYGLYFIFHYMLAKRISKVDVFPGRILVGVSIAIIVNMFVLITNIEIIWFRILYAIIIIICAIIYEEKYIGIIRGFRKREINI